MKWFAITEDQIKQQAKEYEHLAFFQKSKNILFVFILIACLLSVAFIDDINKTLDIHEESKFINYVFFVDILINLGLAGFIYSNHRWAMLIFCVKFLLDKLTFILVGHQGVISPLIFSVFIILLTYSSLKIATELKKQKNNRDLT